jgi:restriction endonuclease S subunit
MQYSIINFKDILKAKRFDSEFFRPEYLEIEEKLNNFNTISLRGASLLITNGHTPRYANLTTGNIKFLTAEHVKDLEIENENTKYIKKEPHTTKLKRTIIKKNDILTTIKGRIGNFATVPFETKNIFNINQDLGRIVLKKEYNPYYFSVFLNSKYGKLQTKKHSTGQINPFLALNKLETLRIPVPSQSFQSKIEKIVKSAYQKQLKSKELYQEAEEILLKELGLKDFEFTEDNISIRNLKDCLKVDRFDAEYWQPKYDEILEKIRKYKNGFDIFNNLVEISEQKIKTKEEAYYNYIELSNVNSNYGVIDDTQKIKGIDLPSRAKMKLQKNDVIMSSIKGSINKVALINSNIDNLVGSTGFFVFRKKYFNPETLMILLKSLFISKLFERESQGTILTAIPKISLSRIILPKLSKKIQKQISDKIKESYNLRKESKELLEKAKKAVEIYIEKDENEAIQFLNV